MASKIGPNWQLIRKIDSKFEGEIIQDLLARQAEFVFHPKPAKKYDIPASTHEYTPDFQLSNGIYIEAKGRLLKKDAEKLLYVRKQHPGMDLRLVFYRLKEKYNGQKKYTVEQWAIDNGFKYSEKIVPTEWIEENN